MNGTLERLHSHAIIDAHHDACFSHFYSLHRCRRTDSPLCKFNGNRRAFSAGRGEVNTAKLNNRAVVPMC